MDVQSGCLRQPELADIGIVCSMADTTYTAGQQATHINLHIKLIVPATPEELDATRRIFEEYAAQLDVDLCFQNFDAELANLPGEYVAPEGMLLLVSVNQAMAGCCAMRPLHGVNYSNACEMKRLYVRPAFRRLGLGRQLAEATVDAAHVAGYHHLLLDTLSDMESARALYADLGFEAIPPYYHNPIAGAHYLKLSLQR